MAGVSRQAVSAVESGLSDPSSNGGRSASSTPLSSDVMATAAALAVTYSGHRCWTFQHRQRHGVPREGVSFLALNAAGLAVQAGCIGLASYVLGPLTAMAYSIALVTGIALATALRYWSYRTWVWPAQPSTPAGPRPQMATG